MCNTKTERKKKNQQQKPWNHHLQSTTNHTLAHIHSLVSEQSEAYLREQQQQETFSHSFLPPTAPETITIGKLEIGEGGAGEYNHAFLTKCPGFKINTTKACLSSEMWFLSRSENSCRLQGSQNKHFSLCFVAFAEHISGGTVNPAAFTFRFQLCRSSQL